MNRFCKRFLAAALLSLILTPSLLLAGPSAEDKLIMQLSSANEQVVCKAFLRLEKEFPTSTNSFPMARKLLTDYRPPVQRKAARYLGALHAKLDEADIKNICAMLTSADYKDVIDGLKALRGLDAPQTVPQILPCLKSSNPSILRDVCRTLAVLGNKDVIPSLEPLLQHADSKVKKDAQDAIAALKAKS
jgi:HEAT repeat protein